MRQILSKMHRKNNLNRLIFAHININSIRNKFDMVASQVKGNVYVIIISETKLDNTCFVDQLVLEGFSKPSRIDRYKIGGDILLFVRQDIPTALISIKRHPLKAFLLNLICSREIGLQIVLTISTKRAYPHIWKSSDELRIFILLIIIILSFLAILM